METADGDRHALLAKLAAYVERAGKLIRLHADERDHPAVGKNPLRNRGEIDDGVALVVDLELDIDVGAENAPFRAFRQQSVDAREAVRRNGRAAPLDDVAVVVVMRRLDQNDGELAFGH